MYQVCRTCLQQISHSNCVSLINSNKSMELKTQLELCVPEMIISLATLTEPVMCTSCVSALHSAYTFKNQCLETEERIRSYMQRKHIGINLNEISGESAAEPIEEESDKFRDVFIKEEFITPESEDNFETPLDEFPMSDLSRKKQLQDLLRQRSRQYRPSSEKPHKCDKCSFSTGDRSTLTKHKAIHSEERPFGCSICSYRTKRKDALTLHMKTHRKVKPNICPECQYSAVTKQCLRRHIMVAHLGLKPFKCSQCNFGSADQGALTKHMLTHTDVKPFECDVCDFSTKRKYTLANHMKSHDKGTI